jgi:SSS family solute:Na+ symporter
MPLFHFLLFTFYFLLVSMGLSGLDLAIIGVYLAGITLFGLCFRRRDRSLRAYFLADRNIPWWAISLSIVAAETSTLTIISIPGLAYATNFTFLQLVFGYIVGRVIISVVLLPHYFRGELVTAYQLMQRRFGERLRSLTAGLFLITRAAAEGVRVFAVAIVVRIALGWLFAGMSPLARDIAAIGIVTALTLIYTFEGGLAAVIWTDVAQSVIYIGGTLIGFFILLRLVPGGWNSVAATAAAAQKFRVFDFTPDFFRTYTFWSGLVGGAFLTTASHGTDQLIVQRLLAARNQRQATAALLASGVIVLVQFALFLTVGAALFVFYRGAQFPRTDEIFPTFIVTHLPRGIAGVMIAAILAAAMSNLSAALNSLSSSSVVDFYARLRPQADERRRVLVSRTSTVIWALVLFALAIVSRRGGRVVEVGLSIASVAYGALLGVFLLGTLTRRANESGAMAGFACGFAFNMYLWLGTIHGRKVPFTWFVLLGSALTFVVGYCSSLIFARNSAQSRE